MKIQKKTISIISFIIVAVVVAACLTALTLFRLPIVYEQTAGQRTISFVLLGVLYLVLVLIASIIFIFPHINQYTKKSNLIFIITMVVILSAVMTVSSAHYWAVPQIHRVKLCFHAENEADNLKILKLVDPNTNRLYSPISFGFERYPIILDSGSCIEGQLTNLLSRLTLALIGYRVDVTVQENPPEGRFSISVNEEPAVVNFTQDAGEQTPMPIVVKDGFDKGTMIEVPWGQHWFIGLKLMIILISALFISLFLFGLTEAFFRFSDEAYHPPNGSSNDEN